MRHLVRILVHLIAFQAVRAFPLLHNIRAQFFIPDALSVRVLVDGRNESFVALPTAYGPTFSKSMEGYVVYSHENAYGCEETTELNHQNSTFEGKIVLFRSGRCSYPMKIHNAQRKGAIAVFIGDNNLGSPWNTPFGSRNSLSIFD